MNNQKNRFWTFVLSLVPGAGEMYFGLYRQGVSLMLCFFIVMLVPLMLQVSALSLLCIILWFYSFLHTHNLRSMPLEEFCQLEDCFLWEGLSQTFQWNTRNKGVLAVALIVIGAFLLWENLFAWLGWYLSGFLGNFFYRLPLGHHRGAGAAAGRLAHHRQEAGAGPAGAAGLPGAPHPRLAQRAHLCPGL